MRSSFLSTGSAPASAQDLRAQAVAGEQNSPAALCCAHCGTALPAGATGAYCCLGCRTVAEALIAGGFERYYELLDEPLSPVGELHLECRDRKWLQPLQADVDTASATIKLQLAVQGIRCAACVWLIERLFVGRPGAQAMLLTPGLGQLSLHVTRGFDLFTFAAQLEELGYLLARPGEAPVAKPSSALLLRASLTSALAANSMMFSLATYVGLSAGALYNFLHSVNYALSGLSVVLGAPVFMGSALRSLRSKIFHLDLPIALGIALSFVAATWAFISDNQKAAYYDCLAVFIALMLWGRYLQGRISDRNRAELLPYDADQGLIVRRLVGQRMEDISAHEVTAGDRLLLAPYDLAPVAGVLQGAAASFSLEWIRGEPDPVVFAAGQSVPAGAVHLGEGAVELIASEAYEGSAVRALLAAPQARACDLDGGAPRRLDFAALYVCAVLGAALLAYLVTWMRSGSVVEGLSAATAACVVSCPCAIGLALPLAQELMQRKLRRMGLFIREASFLERAALVDAIAFDKTGTLTTGTLVLDNVQDLAELSVGERALLYTMVASSVHPHALSLRRALQANYSEQLRLYPDLHAAREVCGAGIELWHAGDCYRYGRPDWACAASAEALQAEAVSPSAKDGGMSSCWTRNGAPLLTCKMLEQPRTAVAEECARLRSLGYRLYIFSGDAQPAVDAMAAHIGVPTRCALGALRPEDKAEVLATAEHRHTLMIGDGINDNLSLERAFAAGTPSLDRPAVSTRADFYYVTPGFSPVTAGLLAGRALRDIRRRSYVFFTVYNLVAVALAITGRIEPWIAAALMPASSLFGVALVTAAVKRMSMRWTS